MSYDLLVFNPKKAPRDRADFMAWYKELTEWKEDRDYNSPDGMSGNLRQFFDLLRMEFPPMNGPFATDIHVPNSSTRETAPRSLWQRLIRKQQEPASAPEFNEAMLTGYSLAQHAIYMTFAWSVAELAFNRVFNTALTSGVGFFDVSDKDGVILHDSGQFEDLMGL